MLQEEWPDIVDYLHFMHFLTFIQDKPGSFFYASRGIIILYPSLRDVSIKQSSAWLGDLLQM